MADDKDFLDGEYVEEGELILGWAIRAYHDGDKVQYDWIADRADGDYDESDDYFDSIEEAKEDLGVR